jgi:catechol 2,3-dioxygenase-like lactoylglutathione lyase family enzyme
LIEKTTHVPIVVSDQDRALKFYTEALGFQKRQDYQQKGRPRWLTVAPPGQEVEFILVRGQYTVDPRPPADAPSGGNHIVFATTDCRKDFEALRARGVKFKDPAPVEAPFGLSAYFADPDGNHLTLLEARASPGSAAPPAKANRKA